MIYLSIPKGMKFDQIEIEKDKRNETGKKIKVKEKNDFFIDLHDKDKKIDIQEIIKEALRENTVRLRGNAENRRTIHTTHFTIYLDNPPVSDQLFLQYKLNKNGKDATEDFKVLPGKNCQKFHSHLFTRHGKRWTDYLYLSDDKRKNLKVSFDDQRDDRRKIGDSPKAN